MVAEIEIAKSTRCQTARALSVRDIDRSYIIYLKVSDIRSVSRGGTSSLRSLVIKWPSAFGTQSVKRVMKQNLENEIRKLTHICSNVSSNVRG